MAKHLLYRDGHLIYKDGHLLSADEGAEDPCACCPGECLCPDGLPTTFALAGHVLYIDPMSMETVCDEDFDIPLSLVEGQPCVYESDLACGGIDGVTFNVVLSLTNPPCQWTLDFSIDTNATTSRAGAGNYLGSYPNTTDGGFSFWITSIVVS